MLLTPVCRWCGTGPLEPAISFETPTPVPELGKGPFHLQSCRACGSWQLNPHPGPEASRRFFASPERWLVGIDPDRKTVNPMKRSESRREEYLQYAQAIKAFLPDSGPIFDVGAGTGLMLSLIDDDRTKVAVEPNIMAARAASARGLSVIQEWAESLSPPTKPLACLIMIQTLDHLPRPDLFLSQAVHWLAPGGLLLLGGLINPDCLTAKIYGPSFRLFHPYHQVYPTPSAVDRVLKPFGLELVSVWRPYFETTHGSVGNFLKACSCLTLKCLRLSHDRPSMAFPGNTVTYLYRKKVLFHRLKATAPAASSLSV
ncbi:MAG: class I SAM-dependent methyltransferase [Deltaproteobacteria bacterium]|nr:class I SAM-dependent methyltransferase [Deltaproteobacteria bacterium]